jgi:hypothetical protein
MTQTPMFSTSTTNTQSRFAPRENLPSVILPDGKWLSSTISFVFRLCETSASLRLFTLSREGRVIFFFLFSSPCRAFPAQWMEVK